MPPKSSIPDRWIPYKACGDVIEGTRIICFKVPLRKEILKGNKQIKEIWDIKMLLETVPKLKAVIDLTNTARYYSPQDLEDAGVKHKKILLPGRIIPPKAKVLEFMNAIDEFLETYSEGLVGVHCTHGLNRTGYMVCRYMRDRLAVNAQEAIKRFEQARGYKIERENYIADILGKDPPAPDLGTSTTIQAVETGNQNWRSRGDSQSQCNGESWRYTNQTHQYWNQCGGPPNLDCGPAGRDYYQRSNSNWRSDCNIQPNEESTWGRKQKRQHWNEHNNTISQYQSSYKKQGRKQSDSKRSDSDRSYDYRYDY